MTANKLPQIDQFGFSDDAPGHAAGGKHYAGNSPADESRTLLTRRNLLFGALGLGAASAIGAGAYAISRSSHTDAGVATLSVSNDDIIESDTLDSIESYSKCLELIGSYDLTYGTLVWANDETYAACLIPTEASAPLTKVGLLNLKSGSLATVLEEAKGVDEGFEIYDVRASSSGLIWTEADVLDGVWRIYTASFSDPGSISSTQLVDEGDKEWETPTITIVDDYAFWQVLPSLSGSKTDEASVLKRAIVGKTAADKVEVVYTSPGRMCSPVYGGESGVVITPRISATTYYYQLTYIDAISAEVLDSCILPSSMKPLEAGYGTNGFMFSFDAIYSYGDGISNLGTYTPARPVTDGQYSNIAWFRFGRTPTAAPCWCKNYFMVKSTSAICGVDLEQQCYFAIDVADGADSYGEYLASTGVRNTIAGYTNINYTALDGSTTYCCRVRAWKAT